MDINKRVDELLKKMTLREKVSLLSGRDLWFTVPIERLGIPSIVMTDGPHGVRVCNPEVGRKQAPSTAFPTGISMGASWNPALIEKVGQALGEETRGLDCDILLGPCVNIVRDPRGGRNFETFSEDPFHAGQIAVSYIEGVQSRGVGTSLKHYAANNYEIERFRASSEVDERTLREIYLPQFEAAVKGARPWTVMCSYNRINGTYASEHGTLLKDVLKKEWGFEGAVISDWGAVHNIYEPVNNGLDLEMPGPARYFKQLADGVNTWQIDESAIDDAARRVLRLIALSGRLDGKVSKGTADTPAHRAVARELAEEAITLLKNKDQALPLKGIRSLAVIGPNAAEASIEGGGSSCVVPPYKVTALQAIQKKLGSKMLIVHEPGCDNYEEPFIVPEGWLPPMRASFYKSNDFSGEPLLVMDDMQSEFWWNAAWSGLPVYPACVRIEGRLSVPEDGRYHFVLRHAGGVRLFLDGELLIEDPANPDQFAEVVKSLKGGQSYALRLDYQRPVEHEFVFYRLGIGRTYEPGQDPRIQQAVEAAKRCEAAVVFVGYPEAFESEGTDRTHIDLFGGQNALISAVAAANPRTVVVLTVGAPVTMPWADEVAGILLAYYPGQEGGDATVRILTGEVNPSGKLPITFPRRLEDSPAFANPSYPGARQVRYGEGIFVGYRGYDRAEIDPLFPFGHGLSYTQFEYDGLKVPAKPVQKGKSVEVKVTVKNTGDTAGKEVVQLYVADPKSSLPRPPKELKAFAKLALKPGESRTVEFELDERALSYYDPLRKAWVAEPGEFEILIGSSSRDIRQRAKFTLE
jgi:beta-glucosidase